jgi:hypothetical protein
LPIQLGGCAGIDGGRGDQSNRCRRNLAGTGLFAAVRQDMKLRLVGDKQSLRPTEFDEDLDDTDKYSAI